MTARLSLKSALASVEQAPPRNGNRRPQSALACAESLERRDLLANIIYVDINAPGPIKDGTSWTQAFNDLQQGLSTAAPGDEIHVADGTYKPTGGTDRNQNFTLARDVGHFGGFAGYGAADPDARDPALHPTILSGDIGVAADTSDNSYIVVYLGSLSSTTTFDGFTVTLGNKSTSGSGGGGAYLIGGNPIVRNCIFTANRALGRGGALYVDRASPTLINCVFSANTVGNYGAAVCNDAQSSPLYIGCVFNANSITTSSVYGYGGAMYNDQCTASLTDCSFTDRCAKNVSQVEL